MTDALKQYYPQAPECFGPRDTGVFCDFLTRWPTLKQVQLACKSTLQTFFRAHHVPSHQVIERRISTLKDALPLTQDLAVIEPNAFLVEALVAQLRATLQAVRRFDVEIASVCATLLDSLFRAAGRPA